MNEIYFSERELGQKARESEVISADVWCGIVAIVNNFHKKGAFGMKFPSYCNDGQDPCGCDDNELQNYLKGHAIDSEWPLNEASQPELHHLFDLLEFLSESVGEPIKGRHHSYYGHFHLSWERDEGLANFTRDLNKIFRLNGLAFEMTPEGKVQRLLNIHLSEAIQLLPSTTGDSETDELLKTAKLKIASPKNQDRQDALEKLWDAFERVKTLGPGSDKKSQVSALLDKVAGGNNTFRSLLDDEAKKLTEIGNNHKIRHSEKNQEKVEKSSHVDYIFGRMITFLNLVLEPQYK